MTTALAPSPLTAADRCDRCGAKAYARVTLAAGGELLFCGHHMNKFRAGLTKVAAEIDDQTEQLDDTPATAAAEER